MARKPQHWATIRFNGLEASQQNYRDPFSNQVVNQLVSIRPSQLSIIESLAWKEKTTSTCARLCKDELNELDE